MAKFENVSAGNNLSHENIYMDLNGVKEYPTREEFYTNYPFYKYWSTENNHKLLSPEGINIYIHIPFCIQICDFCFYMKELIKSKEQVDEYVDALCREIKLVSENFGLGKRKVNSIYMGGGTPSVLTEPQFKQLMDTLHKYHHMENPEFSFEAEPGTFSKNKLEWLKASGVNRISMGIQSFDDNIIKLSSRKHSALQALNSIQTVQETGGLKLNIDLLSGLAGETMSSWQRSVEVAMEQQTDLLTIYKMKTYANTAFFKKVITGGDIELPDDFREISFMEKAMDMLFSDGYNLWSTFAFTKNGGESRYIEHTWRGQDMIAYGASSFGKIGNLNYQNLNNIQMYCAKVNEGTLPLYRSFNMSYKDMMVKELLLCSARLLSYRKTEFIEKFGFDYFDLMPEVIEQLVVKGYILDDRQELVLTQRGVLYADFVSKILAATLKQSIAKDSIGFVY